MTRKRLVASYKIHTVFHVSGCFKFKFNFHNVFSFLISILIRSCFAEPKKIYEHCSQQNMLN